MNEFAKKIRFSQRAGFRHNVVPCFGLGRTNGERISDLKNYGVDSEPCNLPFAYDNDDVPVFTVDDAVNYNVERRRNVVGEDPSYVSHAEPSQDNSTGNTEESATNPDLKSE